MIVRMLAFILVLGAGALAAAYMMQSKIPQSALEPATNNDTEYHGGNGKQSHEERRITLSETQRANAAIELEQAGPAKLSANLEVTGLIRANEENLMLVTPRFPGVIRAIKKRIGDPVAKGEIVAVIESNESLKPYDLVSPIAGSVIDRKGTLGEFADQSARLLTIADLSTVWVEFRIFQQDFAKVRVGQEVEVSLAPGQQTVSSKLNYISPIGALETQSLTARAVVNNPNGEWRPGLFVTGRILLDTQDVLVVVKKSAIQVVDGKSVVFALEDKVFEVREVQLGKSDAEFAEVVSGLSAGEQYVSKNSFVLKAELGKGEVKDAD